MNSLRLSCQSLVPAVIFAALSTAGSALAAESGPTPVSTTPEAVQLAQITSVSELTDVLPSDWAFQALQSLVENYGCIQGYPDRTFRGQRSMTRFEFAAGLNACLDVVATLIAQSGLNPEDLATIRRLQDEFQAELATLRGRVDALEADTATLRAQQFSTTTKLRGQADFHLGVPFDPLVIVNAANAPVVQETSASVAARARLNFDTSFTGRDRLRIRLQSGDGNALVPFGGLDSAGGSGYNVAIDDFYYRFPVGNRINLTVSPRGLSGNDWVTSTIVPYHGSGVADAAKPQFYNSGGSSSNGAGVGVNINLTDSLVFDAGYTAGNPGATQPNVGVFAAANQSYIAQLSYLGQGFLNAGVTYLHNDRSSIFALDNTGAAAAAGATDTFAGLVNLNFGRFFVAGHGAYQTFNGGNDFSWSAGAGINDFLREGAELAVYGTQLPQLAGRSDNPFLIEGYYEIPFSRYLTITPALVYGDAKYANTGGAVTDNTALYGFVRATFRF
ncbi:iron uptake porin [Nodosilinea sp. E11]|uniref:iron uptake porin n=1 Tax=Nodosilinea sp. E11 TaxID=3037479 RepID=UPI0029350C72|nr:iron uptake porin [Nodosilinea sp. E11]WOD39549.1 iron uptake porin [Nodosilinea sp. E11]